VLLAIFRGFAVQAARDRVRRDEVDAQRMASNPEKVAGGIAEKTDHPIAMMSARAVARNASIN
jgi:hypothetical protein